MQIRESHPCFAHFLVIMFEVKGKVISLNISKIKGELRKGKAAPRENCVREYLSFNTPLL